MRPAGALPHLWSENSRLAWSGAHRRGQGPAKSSQSPSQLPDSRQPQTALQAAWVLLETEGAVCKLLHKLISLYKSL